MLSSAVIFAERRPASGWLAPPKAIPDPRSITFTLVFLLTDDKEVLLGLKRRGFGQGLYNGFGGKLEGAESFRDGAAREISEECALSVAPENLVNQGQLHIYRPGAEGTVLACLQLFTCRQWQEEMRPRWFNRTGHGDDAVPYDLMWPEARLFLQHILDHESNNSPPINLTGRVDYADAKSLAGWRLGWKSNGGDCDAFCYGTSQVFQH